MKLPRDISGETLAHALRRYGYDVTRQTGSHLRLTSRLRGFVHHITIPRHARSRSTYFQLFGNWWFGVASVRKREA